MARRRWIKVWSQELLYGSTTAELLPEERWVWIGLLAMAGDSVEQGYILAAPGVPWTKEQIAQILKVPLQVLESALQKMQVIPPGQTKPKVSINGTGVIRIMNWEKYQSDWDRVRHYPSQQPHTEIPTTNNGVGIHTEIPTKMPTVSTEGRGGEGKGSTINKRTLKKIPLCNELHNDSLFDIFWKSYPIKKSKSDAEKAFLKLKPDKELLDIMIQAIEDQKLERDMLTKRKEFVPDWKLPATWLNKRCWEDQPSIKEECDSGNRERVSEHYTRPEDVM